MTIVDLLCYLRQELLKARADKDQEKLRKIWGAIDIFLESAYQSKDARVGSLLEDMGDSIRDSLMDVEWKSTIPSTEDIESLNKIE